MDTRAKELLARYDALRSTRGPYEADLQDIVDLVNPGAMDFNRQGVEGQPRFQYKYDGTAPDALNEFASGLCSYLVNPSDRWFELEFVDYDTEFDEEAAIWLEDVSDLIFEVYRYPGSMFNQSIHESFISIGSLGTCVLFQELDQKSRQITLRSIPLATTFIAEGASQQVDTVFREIRMSRRQIEEKFSQFGDMINPKVLDGALDRKWRIIHCTFPRGDRLPGLSSKTFPFASVWVDVENMFVMRESGFMSFPYHVARWIRFADEPYGRSPAHTCLPDIRTLNVMERTNLKAGQKLVDPPLMVPDDGFLLPIETHPGAILYRQPGAEEIKPLPLDTHGLPIALDMTEQKRQKIRESFHTDWFRLGKEKQEMTATEVEDRRNEKLRLLTPMFGRIQSELLQPMLARTYNLLAELRVIPPSPPSIAGRPVRISFSGGAARAQLAVKAQAVSRFINDLLPIANIRPDVFDILDEGNLAEIMALSRGVSRKVLRSRAEIEAMRKERQQQQQMMAMANAAKPAASALKDVASARQMGAM